MWLLDIKCLALVAVCITDGHSMPPYVERHATQQECLAELRRVAENWKPKGFTSLNCVLSRMQRGA